MPVQPQSDCLGDGSPEMEDSPPGGVCEGVPSGGMAVGEGKARTCECLPLNGALMSDCRGGVEPATWEEGCRGPPPLTVPVTVGTILSSVVEGLSGCLPWLGTLLEPSELAQTKRRLKEGRHSVSGMSSGESATGSAVALRDRRVVEDRPSQRRLERVGSHDPALSVRGADSPGLDMSQQVICRGSGTSVGAIIEDEATPRPALLAGAQWQNWRGGRGCLSELLSDLGDAFRLEGEAFRGRRGAHLKGTARWSECCAQQQRVRLQAHSKYPPEVGVCRGRAWGESGVWIVEWPIQIPSGPCLKCEGPVGEKADPGRSLRGSYPHLMAAEAHRETVGEIGGVTSVPDITRLQRSGGVGTLRLVGPARGGLLVTEAVGEKCRCSGQFDPSGKGGAEQSGGERAQGFLVLHAAIAEDATLAPILNEVRKTMWSLVQALCLQERGRTRSRPCRERGWKTSEVERYVAVEWDHETPGGEKGAATRKWLLQQVEPGSGGDGWEGR